MSSTNQSPFYKIAEAKFLSAKTNEEKIEALKEMIKECPKHKSSENMLANLRTRLKKFLEQQEKSKKSGKSSKTGIKKLEMQAVIVGLVNSGKSSLLSILTNAHPKISETKFATAFPIIGMMPYQGTQIQLIEIPAIDSDFYDKGAVHTADSILILIQNIEELKKIESILPANSKKIIVLNKIDLLSEAEKRKAEATLKSKYKNYEFVFISCKTNVGIENLKDKIFKSFNRIRVFTKEPGKEKSPNPIILKPETSVKEVAEKILKGFAEKVKETKIWGPSSKFSGQKVGLQHKLKDLDVVEFRTR